MYSIYHLFTHDYFLLSKKKKEKFTNKTKKNPHSFNYFPYEVFLFM